MVTVNEVKETVSADGILCNPLSITLEGTSSLEADYEAYYSASELDYNPTALERTAFLTYTDGYKITVSQVMTVAGVSGQTEANPDLNYNGMCFTTN
jgi:hypothetical protein